MAIVVPVVAAWLVALVLIFFVVALTRPSYKPPRYRPESKPASCNCPYPLGRDGHWHMGWCHYVMPPKPPEPQPEQKPAGESRAVSFTDL